MKSTEEIISRYLLANIERSSKASFCDFGSIEATVNKENLSTIIKNEDVEIRVVLKTNDISCDLYKNPIVEVVLPNYIKEINIKSIDLLFDNELKIKDKKTYINDNENVVIQLTLQGEQKNYIQNEVSKGANIIINTDITLKQLTPTKDDVIKVYVTNENVTSYENTESSKTRESRKQGIYRNTIKSSCTNRSSYNKFNFWV